MYSCLDRPTNAFYSQSILPVKVFYYLLNFGLIKYFLEGGLLPSYIIQSFGAFSKEI
jgi:hypothetical protein